jgi:hypothetical protein
MTTREDEGESNKLRRKKTKSPQPKEAKRLVQLVALG